MKNVALIIIDMDGTLYDMTDLIEAGFSMSVSYLMEYYEFEKEEAEDILNRNHIYPYVAPDAASTTQFLLSRFIDLDHWDEYRSRNFAWQMIDKEKAVKEETLRKLSKIAPLVLLTNNTRVNVSNVLKQISIPEDVFDRIVCNEKHKKSFSKRTLMKELIEAYNAVPEQTLSIGDRYDVDGKPMIELGGSALILKKPSALEKFLEEIEDPKDCAEYLYYK